MAEDTKKNKEDEKIEVPMRVLTSMQEQMAELERKVADGEAKAAGLAELVEAGVKTNDEPQLRKKRSFEPKFRTVKIRKYPKAGNIEDLGYIIGWTSRGAYQEVDRSGVSPQVIDYIDVIFLGDEKTKEGKLKTEKIRLLDMLNQGVTVNCKILNTKREEVPVETNEEIDVTVFDPAHGMISTGEKIDGVVTHSEIQYELQIPGVDKPVWVDAEFLN